MSVLNRQFPPPIDWQAFERLCADLFRREWRDPGAQLNGRGGQRQSGVDVYGEDKQDRRFKGVQCKGRDGEYGAALTEKELRDEVEKAKSFKPPLQSFILATTAPNDVKVQQVAREITVAHRQAGLFDVDVYGWTTLKQLISDHPDLVQKHYPDLAPVDLVAAIGDSGDRIVGELSALFGPTLDLLTARFVGSPAPAAGGVEDALHARIRDASALTLEGQARAALGTLRRLRETEWKWATARNRFRLLAAIASAQLVLGDQPTAVAGFRDAYQEAPDFPPARAILATAHLFDGERALAWEQATAAFRDDPGCEQAAIIMLQAAPDTLSAADLEALVPEPLRATPAVAVILATVQRSRGDLAAALRLAEACHGLAPNDWRAAALLAELLLAPILDDPALPLTKAIPAATEEDFARALALLKDAWSAVQNSDFARHALHIALNLATTLDVAGEEADAAIVEAKGLAIDGSFHPLLRRLAMRRALDADWNGALAVLDRMKAEDREPEDELLSGQAKLALGRADEARRTAQAILDVATQGRLAELAAALALEADMAGAPVPAMVDAWLDRFPDAMLMRTAITRSKAQRERLRERLIADVGRLTQVGCDRRDRIMGADILACLGEHAGAAELLDGVVDTRLDTHPLRGWLRALLLADRRKQARQLFERLPNVLREQTPYLELGVATYERGGFLPKARSLLDGHLTRHPQDLHARLGWLALCERLGDLPAVSGWLQAVPDTIEGPPQDLMALAHAIDRHLGEPKALYIGYRAVRAEFGNPRLQLAYSVGLILLGRAIKRFEQHETEIVADRAVVLEQIDGDRRLTRVIETADDPRIESDEIPTGNALAVRLLGLKVGDVVQIETVGLGPVAFRVARVTNKFLHLHFRILAGFENLFPEYPGFGSVPCDPAKGPDGLQPMLRIVRERGEFVRDLEAQYQRGAVPLSFVAAASGATMFDVWEAFTSVGETRLYTSNGSAEEFARAAETLEEPALVILEPLAVYSTSRLDLEAGLRATGKRLGVTQTTRDLLRELLQTRKRDADSRTGTLAWDGEHYLMRDFSIDEAEEQIRRAEDASSFADRCELIAAEGSAVPLDEAREVWRFLPEALQDSVFAAQGSGGLLLSDDLPLRALAEASAGVRTVWTQPLLQLAHRQGRLSAADYAQSVGKLVDRNYQFTMFGAFELRHALDQVGWVGHGRVQRLIELVAKPSNDPATVVAMLSQFTEQAWRDEGLRAPFRSILATIFAAFRRQDRVWAEHVMALTLDRLAQVYRQRAWITRRHLWLRTTSLVPAERVAAEILAPADRIIRRIADVFTTCLETETVDTKPRHLSAVSSPRQERHGEPAGSAVSRSLPAPPAGAEILDG